MKDSAFAAAPRARKADYALLFVISLAASLAAFSYFFLGRQILLYGDAVAHINIARRVFDSRTPGWQQLGTVWLPLPHVLTLPFIIANAAWQSGWGGSVVSMAAFVAGALGMARLFWGGGLGRSQRWPGWLAALFYALNPNLLYLQATAMTESLSLALYVWALAFFAEFLEHRRRALAAESLSWERSAHAAGAARALERCALALGAGMLTRYDHWLLAALIVLTSLLLLRKPGSAEEAALERARMHLSLRRAIVFCGVAGALWLGYNLGTYGNALEFATGPYSARAIQKRSGGGMSSYPGERSLPVAALYYLRAAEMNVAEGGAVVAPLAAAVAGICFLLWQRRVALLLALWLPLVFYAFALAYLSVPIFIPTWWPFSYYNLRYGLELLPAFAASAGIALWLLSGISHRAPRRAAVTVFVILLAAGYGAAWRRTPICLREARANSVSRVALESKLAEQLRRLPPRASVLMATGSYSGALELAGMPLERTINENNGPLWRTALAAPASNADYVVAAQGDAVWQALARHSDGLAPLAFLQVSGQLPVTIYRSLAAPKR